MRYTLVCFFPLNRKKEFHTVCKQKLKLKTTDLFVGNDVRKVLEDKFNRAMAPKSNRDETLKKLQPSKASIKGQAPQWLYRKFAFSFCWHQKSSR